MIMSWCLSSGTKFYFQFHSCSCYIQRMKPTAKAHTTHSIYNNLVPKKQNHFVFLWVYLWNHTFVYDSHYTIRIDKWIVRNLKWDGESFPVLCIFSSFSLFVHAFTMPSTYFICTCIFTHAHMYIYIIIIILPMQHVCVSVCAFFNPKVISTHNRLYISQ